MAQVPREDRPTAEMLDTYTESRYEPDEDLSAYMTEQRLWLHDYRRDQEEKRESEQQGMHRSPLLGHDVRPSRGGISGFNPEGFDLKKVAATVHSRPLH